jgi:hypothetical protein
MTMTAAHTVIAKRDGEDLKLEIKQHENWITMSDDEWFSVRDTLDAAIKLAGGPDVGVSDLEGTAIVRIYNEE